MKVKCSGYELVRRTRETLARTRYVVLEVSTKRDRYN
jgi:hypothetical protein